MGWQFRIMARPLRVNLAGSWNHGVSRGNGGEALYRDDTDNHRKPVILLGLHGESPWELGDPSREWQLVGVVPKVPIDAITAADDIAPHSSNIDCWRPCPARSLQRKPICQCYRSEPIAPYRVRCRQCRLQLFVQRQLHKQPNDLWLIGSSPDSPKESNAPKA